MSTSGGSPSSLATLGRILPIGVPFGCTIGSQRGSMPGLHDPFG